MKTVYLIALIVILFNVKTALAYEDNSRYVANWAQNAASEVMSFHFGNFEERKKENRMFFTETGFQKFYDALDISQIPQVILKNKIIVKTEVLCFPEAHQIIENQKKYWILEFPIKMSFLQKSKVKKDYLKVWMKVGNMQKTQPTDFGIEQWIATETDKEHAQICSEKKR